MIFLNRKDAKNAKKNKISPQRRGVHRGFTERIERKNAND
jgi:hypothetical protein